MKQGKKFISPGAWFSMVYPADWNEFEDGEGSFLFYNPNEWTGNFRISAYKGSATYGKEAVEQELKENTSATSVKIGPVSCAYSLQTGYWSSILNIRMEPFPAMWLLRISLCGMKGWMRCA